MTVARVTDTGRLVMRWRGEVIVDLSRAFLDTNGAPQCTQVRVPSPDDHHNVLRQTAAQGVPAALEKDDVRTAVLETLRDLNVCSQRGLVEMFDASIGASSVTMPFGGATQMTPVQTMSALFPVLKGTTSCMSMMSYGFDPYLSSWSPYHGAHYAILHSVAKICASGADPSGLHFTFQEYFGKTSGDPASWGAPFAALLGAFEAQLAYGCAAIGGKDSMSGTFGSISVPPTLVSFAVAVGDAAQIVTPEFKKASSFLVLFEIEKDEEMVPRHREALAMYGEVHRLMREKKILSCYAADAYGLAAALNIMSFGNELGVTVDQSVSVQELFENLTGSLVAEVDAAHLIDALRVHGARKIGTVTKDKRFVYENCEILQPEALQVFNSRLEKVYPVSASSRKDKVDFPAAGERSVYICRHRHARPRVFIPLFPGTNCEYDLTRAFASAGADVSSRVFCNMKNEDIRESVRLFRKEIDQAQILMFPGGFSAGDEPDGSAKFFAAAFRNEEIAGAVMRLLEDRDGLALGICNGFQAMIKLGLLPGGRIEQQTKRSPTLTYNTIGRHVSRMAHLRVIDTHSPWLALCKKDEVYTSPVSHGEGRFVGDEDVIQKLFENGQVATLYADPKGNVTMDDLYNLNGSYCSIEGITSPDGRCYGKMAHAERKGAHVQVNVPGEQDMRLFEAGVRYFSEGKEA